MDVLVSDLLTYSRRGRAELRVTGIGLSDRCARATRRPDLWNLDCKPSKLGRTNLRLVPRIRESAPGGFARFVCLPRAGQGIIGQ